jgi:GH25 family lysozyme M1 (1,4-beta-N-acetylmuramidase)
MVTVYKPTDTTPVHPEAITHAQLDGMASVVAGPVSHTGQAGLPVEDALTSPAPPPGLPGIDVSSRQGSIPWSSVARHVSFVFVKATEGTYYTNPDFNAQYQGVYYAHRIHGAYHLAIPSNSGGAVQANYFAHHGGGWSADGRTLPGTLDIEPNFYGAECFGLSKSQMTSWIWSFVREYAYDTGVYPVIYTSYLFWRTCTGNANGFQKYDPLWIACYCSSAGALPSGYGFYTFWQYSDIGSLPGDQDVFNGSPARLEKLTLG